MTILPTSADVRATTKTTRSILKFGSKPWRGELRATKVFDTLERINYEFRNCDQLFGAEGKGPMS